MVQYIRYKAVVLDPPSLIDYGFVEMDSCYLYEGENSKGRRTVVIRVWKGNVRHEEANYINFPAGNPSITLQLAFLFAKMYADKVIEFIPMSGDEALRHKIELLEAQIKKMKDELQEK